jgi:drug/metabolite transporter (DMT)-like permease
MSTNNANLRGIAFMSAATASFITNDTILQFVMHDLPPFETLFWRGVLTVLWGIPLLGFTGNFGGLPKMLDKGVLGRSTFELLAVLGYILALKYAPIADVTALSQLAPMILTLAAVWLFGVKVGRWEIALICLALFGALLVAQPGGSGFSAFALFGLWNAVASVGRDLAGRMVAKDVPALVVPVAAGISVLVGAGVVMVLFEHFVMPDGRLWLLLAASALFLTGGHYLIFLAYRVGTVGAVAPFFYTGTIWALLSGLVAFGQLPNALALGGIALILLSGVAVVYLDARRTWMTGTA